MAVISDYITGKIVLTNGSVNFTGIDTGWLAADFKEGDTVFDVKDQNQWTAVIATIDTNTSGTFTNPWQGISGVYDYRMRYLADNSRVAAQARNLIELLGDGNLVSFASLEGSQGKIPIFTSPNNLELIDAGALGGGGSGGDWDATVLLLSELSTYDNEDVGFRVMVINNGDGRSALYEKKSATSGDWYPPIYFTGNAGAAGPAPNLTIGNVSGVPSGTPPSATITGTSPNLVLNMVLEKGETGDITPEAEAARDAAIQARDDAASSATAASTSATNAGNSASAAASSATAASTSATNAGNSASAAAGSANDAAGSASDAANSASAASDSASDAFDLATAADGSASAAASSATAASTSATNAGNSASAAAGSANDAAGSASDAASSAGAASASAANAQTARQGAEDARDEANSIVGNLEGGTTGQFLVKNSDTDFDYDWATPQGNGDVLGPSSSTIGNLAVFDSATGKLISDSGISSSSIITDAVRYDAPQTLTSAQVLIAQANIQAASNITALAFKRELVNEDLNALVVPGMYTEVNAADATLANNFPVAGLRGVVMVYTNPTLTTPTLLTQTFTSYTLNPSTEKARFFTRFGYQSGGTWTFSVWEEMATVSALAGKANLSSNTFTGTQTIDGNLISKGFEFRQPLASNLHLWFQNETGSERGLIYVAGNSNNMLFRVGGTGAAAGTSGIRSTYSLQATGVPLNAKDLTPKDYVDSAISNATANAGTVTSVGVAVPTGFVASGAVTTSGNINITYSAGYQGFTTAESTKLAGIESGAQVNPGLSTASSDGLMSSAQFTKLAGIATGATANVGTVTSVGVAVPTGFAASGAVTSSGNINITYSAGYQGFTTSESTKLAGIAAGAQVNTVTSVAGKTGAVTLVKGDVGLGNVDNTSDVNKPVSTAQAASINTKITRANDTGLGGFTSVLASDGNSPANYTPSPVGSNFKHIGNTGAFTFNAPTLAGEYTLVISVENGGTAGAITFAGFSIPPIGDVYDTTAGRRWVFTITKVRDRKIISITRAS